MYTLFIYIFSSSSIKAVVVGVDAIYLVVIIAALATVTAASTVVVVMKCQMLLFYGPMGRAASIGSER